MSMRAVRVPDGARFSCRSCGQCCQGWAVPLDEETVERLRAHDWGDDPFEKHGTAGAPYRIRLIGDRCFFLDAQNRCRIHTEISYEAKPAVCKAFPLTVLEVEGVRHARLSFWCPTVVENGGKPLDHQSRWLAETARRAERRGEPLRLNDAVPLTVREFERLDQTLRRFAGDRSVPMSDRLAAASALLSRLSSDAGGGAALEGAIADAQRDGVMTLAAEARRQGRAAGGKRLLSLYLLYDTRGGRFAGVARMVEILLFNAGLARLSSRAMRARASWPRIRRVRFELSAAGDELLTRYVLSKLESRRYVAGDASVIVGFNLLLAAYGVINLLARLRAASADRPACDEEDVRQAVRAADLLVVEHRSHDQDELHVRLTASVLGNPHLGGDLLARLHPID